MKIPLKWLRDYVDIKIAPEELAHRLTMAGLETGEVLRVGAEWDNVYVGQVAELKPHPNADRLQLVTADYGRGTITVVTGAFNMKVGDKVPVALIGARLIDGHAAEPRMITLQRTRLRGVVSEGMVCSGKELGLSDDHSGILILHPEARVGAELEEELGETILDLSLTPNRSDALSLIGVAREVVALTGERLRYPPLDAPEEGPPASEIARVDVLDPDLCPRYSAMVIRGVKIDPSPRWLQQRLTAAGVRPISNIVDVTNYVMLEMGQPLHAFDLRTVRDNHIIVRRSRPGETLVTLDGVARSLEPDMLLIADPAGGIGLAGVMGGANTEITEDTTDILLEAANFHPINNRRTARGLGLLTEASRRFEKGLPPELTVPALRRSMRLMRELAGGNIARGVIDAYPVPAPRRQVLLPGGEVKRLLGADPGAERVQAILTSLEFKVEPRGEDMLVTVPPHRVDVSLPADLVEEVARISGYETLPETLLSGELPPQSINELREWEAVAREVLIGSGLAEVICYSLTSRQRLGKLLPRQADGSSPAVLVRPDPSGEPQPLAGPLPPIIDPALYSGEAEPLLLLNPLASESEALRTTAMGSLLETLRDNLRHEDRNVDLFEIGRIYVPRGDDLPDERRVVTIAMDGYRGGRALGERVATDFFDLKGVVQALLERFGVEEVSFVPVVHPVFHPGRAALVVLGSSSASWTRPEGIAGILGEVAYEVAASFDFESRRAYLATLDLGRLVEAGTRTRRYRPLPKYPPVMQDIAVILDEAVAADEVGRQIFAAGGELLREAKLFDVYTGPPIPAGKKSLAYSLTYQSVDHTLTDEEVRAVHKRIEDALTRNLGARIRGE